MQDSGPDRVSELTDEQLLELHRGGHTRAFERLIARYEAELFHFLFRFTGERAAAEDLFQEAFLQVHLAAETFDTSRKFKPWLFTIAANKARDLLRRNTRRQTAALSNPIDAGGDGDRSFLDLLESNIPSPVEDLESHETRERVRTIISEMPDHLREVLLLAYFHQFPGKEIAEMLSVPLGTVKSRLHAAVAAFAARWEETGESKD
jgi:RNA polymerase sigma-70 factor (ECF subfamily)